MIVARSGAEQGNFEWLEKLQCSSGVPNIVKSVLLCSVGTGKCSSAGTNDCGTERSVDGKFWMAREIAMFKWCSRYCKSVPLRSVGTGKCWTCWYQWLWHGAEWSRAEMGNNEWLEKLQCSSGVPIIVKSFMFVIDNHANKNKLIKNLVMFVPTKLSSLVFSSNPFRSDPVHCR